MKLGVEKGSRMFIVSREEKGFSLIGVMITFAIIGGMLTTYMMKNRNNRIQRARENLFYGSNEIIPALRASLEKDINGGKKTNSTIIKDRCKNENNPNDYEWSISAEDSLKKLNPSMNSLASSKLKEFFPNFDISKCSANSYKSFCFYSMRSEKSSLKHIGRTDSFFGADFAFVHFMVDFRKGNTGKSYTGTNACKKFNQVLVYTSKGYIGANDCKDDDGNLLPVCLENRTGSSKGIFQAKAVAYYQVYVGVRTGSKKKLVRSIRGVFSIGQTVNPSDEVNVQFLDEEDE
jgi:Tfp pilus assembly protein PilE